MVYISTEPYQNRAIDDMETRAMYAPLDYDYEGLDLKPGSMLHRKIVEQVSRRAHASNEVLQRRHSSWDEIDRCLTAYVDATDSEKKILSRDPRKPVAIKIPVMFAAREAILAHRMDLYLRSPIFRYEGVGPEDHLGAIMLEMIIDKHVRSSKAALALMTQWSDELSYGFGAVSPVWATEMGLKTIMEPTGFDFGDQFIQTGERQRTVETVVFDGNKLISIDPRRYLPDPGVPIECVQDGEFVGWVERTNLQNLLDREKAGEVFNVRYLRTQNGAVIDGRSAIINWDDDNARDRDGLKGSHQNDTSCPVDVIWMYINIIPKDWKLGDKGEYPEKWLFAVAGDSLVIQAQPLNLNHGRYPVCVSAPDTDGHSIAPLGRLEVMYGLQTTMDWILNARVKDIRRSVNNRTIYDPSVINTEILRDPEQQYIPTRRSRWGTSVKDAVMPMPVSDVTSGHFNDMQMFQGMIMNLVGASPQVMGTGENAPERRSAVEASALRGASLSRIDKLARTSAIQSQEDVAYLFAAHTKQLMTDETYVRATGEWESRLAMEYPGLVQNGRVRVSPKDINIEFDIMAAHGGQSGGDAPEVWAQILQTVLASPLAAQHTNIPPLMMHTWRMLGAKNAHEFVNANVQMQTMSPEETIAQADAGNIIPVGAAQ